uniref:Uncharacterized protein n=1 Tax=Populus trichocarpa TaxID=3694 RepID=A0A3N7ERP8_POPTR
MYKHVNRHGTYEVQISIAWEGRRGGSFANPLLVTTFQVVAHTQLVPSLLMLFLPPILSFFHHSAIVSVCARCLSLTNKCTLLFITSPTNSDKFMHHGLVLPSLVLLKEWTARCYEVYLKGTVSIHSYVCIGNT